MFHAFGTPPPLSVIWMCYFVGTLANLLPLPGGLGGVEGGMIGAFAAFGVSFDLAVLAVLSYRAISFWLPTIPGGIAYFQLRRTVAQWKSDSRPRVRSGTRSGRPGWSIAGRRGRSHFGLTAADGLLPMTHEVAEVLACVCWALVADGVALGAVQPGSVWNHATVAAPFRRCRWRRQDPLYYTK